MFAIVTPEPDTLISNTAGAIAAVTVVGKDWLEFAPRRDGCRRAIISSHELDEVRRLEPLVKILVSGEIAPEVRSRDGEMTEAQYLAALRRAGIDVGEGSERECQENGGLLTGINPP